MIYLFMCWRRCREEYKAESEPLAFTGVDATSAGHDSRGVRHRQNADVPVLGRGQSGDAYIDDLVRLHREQEAGAVHASEQPLGSEQLGPALERFVETGNADADTGAGVKVPKSNVVPVDDDG